MYQDNSEPRIIAIFVRTANCNFNRFVNVFAVYYLFSKFSFSNTIRVTNSLDPDQVQRPNCLQSLSVYGTSSRRVNLSVEGGIYIHIIYIRCLKYYSNISSTRIGRGSRDYALSYRYFELLT